jgi:hypothetical protein
MPDAPALPPAGWQPDPEQPDTWRYWDGEKWTDQRAPMKSANAAPTAPGPRKSGPGSWRKMTWVLIVWCAIILVWAIAGGGAAADDCADKVNQLNQDACEAGTGIGIAIILLIGFFGFAFFSIIWFMTRPKDA